MEDVLPHGWMDGATTRMEGWRMCYYLIDGGSPLYGYRIVECSVLKCCQVLVLKYSSAEVLNYSSAEVLKYSSAEVFHCLSICGLPWQEHRMS